MVPPQTFRQGGRAWGGERLPVFHQRHQVLCGRKQDPSYQHLIKFCKSSNWFEFERILNLDFSPHFLSFIFSPS